MSGLTVDQPAGRDRTAGTLCKDRQSGSALLRWPPGTVMAGKASAWSGAISPGVDTAGTQLHAVAHSAHGIGKAHGASKVHRAGTAWQGKASVSMPFLGRSACNMAWPGTAHHRERGAREGGTASAFSTVLFKKKIRDYQNHVCEQDDRDAKIPGQARQHVASWW